jgi:hypothetical protein
MAYAFDRIKKLVDKKSELFEKPSEPMEEGERVDADVFEGAVPAETEERISISTAPAAAAPTQPGLGGEIATTKPRSRASLRSPFQVVKGAPRRAIEANVGYATLPGKIGDLERQLREKRKEIRADADKWGEERYKEYGNKAPDDVGGTIRGGGTNYDRLKELMGKGDVRDVPEPKIKDYSVEGVEGIDTDRGIREMLRVGKGPRYTPGMAAFDYEVIRRRDDFPGKIKNLLKEEKDLGPTARDIYNEVRGRTRSRAKGALEKEKDRIRRRTLDLRNSIEDSPKAKKRWEAYKNYMRKTRGEKIQEYFNNDKTGAWGQFAQKIKAMGEDPRNLASLARFQSILDDLERDPNLRKSVGWKEVQYPDMGTKAFMDSDQVAIGKRIGDILGYKQYWGGWGDKPIEEQYSRLHQIDNNYITDQLVKEYMKRKRAGQ